MSKWRFYGRNRVKDLLQAVLSRDRFFFLKIEGRRRIGKSRLVLQCLADAKLLHRSFRVQVPDAEPGGLITTVEDALSIFKPEISSDLEVKNLRGVARLIRALLQANYIVVIDEFQYLNRERLRPLLSYLQEVVDEAKFNPSEFPGGLIVAGSIHTEMEAILESKDAPLYGRITDRIELEHFTPATIKQILQDQAKYSPENLLFFYSLLEGVPKYYEDVYERELFGKSRKEILQGLFFDSSAPLANEAETWFLHGLKGRYITILSALAQRNGFATHHEIQDFISQSSLGESDRGQVGVYLEALINRYKILVKQQPIFTRHKSRHTRFTIHDNFLLTWLSAVAPSFRARGFMPLLQLLESSELRLANLEGIIFEKLVRNLIRQRSRESLLDFNLTQDIEGYWNERELEVDLILIDEVNQRIRFGSCKREGQKLVGEVEKLPAKVEQLVKKKPFNRYASWYRDFTLYAPTVPSGVREKIVAARKIGVVNAVSLDDLIDGTGCE